MKLFLLFFYYAFYLSIGIIFLFMFIIPIHKNENKTPSLNRKYKHIKNNLNICFVLWFIHYLFLIIEKATSGVFYLICALLKFTQGFIDNHIWMSEECKYKFFLKFKIKMAVYIYYVTNAWFEINIGNVLE